MRWLKEMTLKYNSHEKENTKWVSFVCLCALRQVNTRKSAYFSFSKPGPMYRDNYRIFIAPDIFALLKGSQYYC